MLHSLITESIELKVCAEFCQRQKFVNKWKITQFFIPRAFSFDTYLNVTDFCRNRLGLFEYLYKRSELFMCLYSVRQIGFERLNDVIKM